MKMIDKFIKIITEFFENCVDLFSTNRYALAIATVCTIGTAAIAFLSFICKKVFLKKSAENSGQPVSSNIPAITTEQRPVTLSTSIPSAIDLIGREKDIQAINDLLEQHRIVSIHADGGVGKTAVAAVAANKINDDIVSGKSSFKHIAWINSTGNLQNDLIGLDIPAVVAEKSKDKQIKEARMFLENTPTFLIIDNMDDPPTDDEEDLMNTIAGKTKILITTRANIPVSKKYDLSNLDLEFALVLFYRHYKSGADLTVEQIKKQEDVLFAEKIVAEASFNALFIELIGKMAYADHWNLPDLWKKLEKDVFSQDSKHDLSAGHGKSHPESKGKLLTQIQRLYEMSTLSDRQKEIMSFIALFPPEHSIFFDVFKWAGFEDDEEDNLGALQDKGWIERDDEGYLIHTMVKGSVELQTKKTSFDEDRYEKLIVELCKTDQYMPEDMVYTKLRERIVVPETVCKLLIDKESEKENSAWLYNNMALVYSKQGNYEKALEYNEKVQVIREKVLGKKHPSTATTYNNIAVVYYAQGNYEKALEYHEKALAIIEKVLGKEHPDTATTYNNMALVYSDQGNYKKALEYYEKAQVIQEKVLGKEHPDTATTYNNIALIYSNQGNYEKALEYYEKAQVIREKVLGKEHPDTATTYNNMAGVYRAQGNYEKALEYFEKAQVIQEKVLGKEHPYTGTTYSNMALVYSDQGNYKKALEYYEKAQVIQEKVLGKEHPDTATTYNNMALLYSAQGNYEKALEYNVKAQVIREKVLGKEHPDTATTYNNIALVYSYQRNYEKALEYYEKARAISEKVLGKEHPSTATMYNNMAGVYSAQGNYEKALEYNKKAQVIQEKVLGKEHPSTATTYNNMASVYSAQGNYEKALEYFEKAQVIREKVLGKEHPDTATTYTNIAGMYCAQGNYEKALEYFEKALIVFDEKLGEDHPYTRIVKEAIEILKT